MNRIHFTRQFNWRMMLVRVLVNALALLIISLLPDITIVDPTLLRVLLVALILGVLNAFIKPIVQFLTLRFIFITYGFAVVIINTIILYLLSFLASSLFVVDGLLWAIVGGALMGLVTAFLESLFGLQIPIMPERVDAPSSLLADPSNAFQTMLVSEVIGPEEELAAELPPAEAQAAAQIAAGEAALAQQEEE